MTTPFAGVALVVAAMAVESSAQLLLKVGAAGGASCLVQPFRDRASRLGVLRRPASWIALGVAAYVLETALYTLALARLDVSVAFPLGSLCFVGVALLSRLLLGEAVGPTRFAGVALIILGSAFLAW
jgi:drug/metabolite transporter (DMT)-like permease